MRNVLYTLLSAILILSTFSLDAATGIQADFFSRYAEIAQDEMREHNIPASIKLAQAALESSYGRGELALEANNFFGIKCWDCETSYAKFDDEKNADGTPKASTFKVFANPMASFKGHTEFLTNNKAGRYNHLFELAAGDYRAWAKGLKKAGYATDEGYAQKLINIIEENNLHIYDLEVINEGLSTNNTKTDALNALANIKLDDSKVDGTQKTLSSTTKPITETVVEEDVFANLKSTNVENYTPAFMKQK